MRIFRFPLTGRIGFSTPIAKMILSDQLYLKIRSRYNKISEHMVEQRKVFGGGISWRGCWKVGVAPPSVLRVFDGGGARNCVVGDDSVLFST